MWRPEELRERLRGRPFRPLLLLDSLNARYEIRHPELVMVGERSLTIGIPSPSDPAIYTHTVCISLEHVVRWEDLPLAGPPTSGNGESSAPPQVQP